MAAPAKQVRRPGRPPKTSAIDSNAMTHGIVTTPIDEENVFEMEYDNPRLFKQLCAMLKNFCVNELVWHITTDEIKISTIDGGEVSKIFIVFRGHMMTRFYVKEPIDICVKRETLEKIFKVATATHKHISFVLKAEDASRVLYLSMRDSSLDMDLNYEIELIQRPMSKEYDEAPTDDYPIKFEMPMTQFKTLLADINVGSDIFNISKYGDEPLELGYNIAQKINLVAVFRNPEKIKLQSKIDPDDIFSVTVNIPRVKPFSSSSLGTQVKIAADRYKPICMTTSVDTKKRTLADGSIVEGAVCVVSVHTEVHDNKIHV